MAMLGTFIMLQALSAIVTLALAIGLYQDQKSWPIDTILLFTTALLALVITFPTHFLTTSDEFLASPRRVFWRLFAGPHKLELFLADSVAFIQFSGFGLSFAAFVYGLATNVNGKCTGSHLTYCQVFRINLGFDTLLWLFQLTGFVLILMSLRPARPKP